MENGPVIRDCTSALVPNASAEFSAGDRQFALDGAQRVKLFVRENPASYTQRYPGAAVGLEEDPAHCAVAGPLGEMT
jgi:hypothetical protein